MRGCSSKALCRSTTPTAARPRQRRWATLCSTVVDCCRELVDADVPAATVEDMDFGPLLRARDEAGPDDVAGVASRRDLVLARLRERR